jgi:repressor LexA
MRHANRDADHLNALRQYYAQNRRIPSYQRIAELLGFASRAAAVKFMQRIEAESYVTRTPDDDAWMPARRFFEYPLALATVQAGQPAVAIDVSAEPFLFDDYLVKKPADTVVVPVQGDSMIEAGIFEGDLAVVERTASAKLGSFVVAQVEDRFTLKELVKVDGAHALKAHNRRYPLIRPEGAWHIFGVMVGLVRRYQRY